MSVVENSALYIEKRKGHDGVVAGCVFEGRFRGEKSSKTMWGIMGRYEYKGVGSGE
jgi:hypothetical protein